VSIERFREAQNASLAGFEAALHELRTGAKRGHWIWYVFPQLDGLGSSPQSRRFAIAGEDEAAAFLRDAELRSRLLAITTVVIEQLRKGTGTSLGALMGSEIDARKLVSSLTLFERVAGVLHEREGDDAYGAIARAARQALDLAAAEGYPRCAYTLSRLNDARPPRR
jgi:uncharacterized protein (DUF1810 family)